MKIDTTKIEGYENMTAEEKIAALEAYDEQPDLTGYVKKDLLDKANKEAASYKKQLKDKMTEDEVKAQAEAERIQSMENELAALRKKDAINENYAKFIALGYADELAKKTAEAMVEGDLETVFKNQATHQANIEQKVKADLMKKTPTPPAGTGSNAVTKEAFMKMSMDEKTALYNSDPETFKRLSM